MKNFIIITGILFCAFIGLLIDIDASISIKILNILSFDLFYYIKNDVLLDLLLNILMGVILC